MNSTVTRPRANTDHDRYGNQGAYDDADRAHYYDRTQVVSAPVYSDQAYPAAAQSPAGPADGLDQTRFWVGAGITAAITAIIAVIGTIVAHGILHIGVLTDAAGQSYAMTYALASAGIALAAAGLFDVMLQLAPRPRAYFGALCGALIALAVLVPFTTALSLPAQTALALMNLAVAATIAVLVPLAATTARR